jgi:nucleotide-binding universal stress UspA family protein
MRARLDRIAREGLPAGVRCEIEISVGTPSHSIVAAQAAHAADLIVMATHGRKRSAVGHFLLDSVAERVARESAYPNSSCRPLIK